VATASAPRWNAARNAYGPTSSKEEQQQALEVSLAAGVNFIDTAARYGKGASARRVGQLTFDRDVVLGTKFPFSRFTRPRHIASDTRWQSCSTATVINRPLPGPLPKAMDADPGIDALQGQCR
jgi:aryl-alcohol dehydrogenase-like predicted oxidoreductase